MTDNTNVTTTNSAAVVEQSLMAFGAGMSYQSRSDVKSSFQLASLVASKRYSQGDQAEQWFDEFIRTLEGSGWAKVRRTFEREDISGKSLTLGAIAFKAMKVAGQTLVGGPLGEAMISLASQAVDGLDKVTEPQQLFSSNVKKKSSATVGLASCMEISEGEVLMGVAAISAATSQNDLDTLVFEWKSTSSQNYSGMALLSFNKASYNDKLREAIIDKLAERAFANVMDFDI
ncbi:hypothetical protein ACQKPE_15420 [Pseudomonas sp. NPDC089554]|uniref:hypothetical protein n=1 Tax=Pseudomonas sp. NPDC089554 TaxID=3390653 RepID=UPI003D079457